MPYYLSCGAVDEEQGIVWLRQDFGPGSVMGANAASRSLTCWEMFKVYGGSIHAVEALHGNHAPGPAFGLGRKINSPGARK